MSRPALACAGLRWPGLPCPSDGLGRRQQLHICHVSHPPRLQEALSAIFTFKGRYHHGATGHGQPRHAPPRPATPRHEVINEAVVSKQVSSGCRDLKAGSECRKTEFSGEPSLPSLAAAGMRREIDTATRCRWRAEAR